MKYLILIVLEVFFLLEGCVAVEKDIPEFPSSIQTCRRTDPKLNQCIKDSVNSLKDRLPTGIPEIFVPPIEPLVIPEIKMNQDSGAIYLHSSYNNIKVHGLSDFSLKDLNMDMDKLKFTMTLIFPELQLDADYKMKGKIMMMPLVGEGNCKANFTNVELSTVIFGQKTKRSNQTFIKTKKIKVDYKLGKANVFFDNLFNGDTALGNRMNRFLNKHWSSLSDEIQPLLQNAITEIIRSSTDKIFNTYSLDQILPE